MKKIYIFLLFFFIVFWGVAQTAGDVCIIGMNTDNPDEVLLVSLVDLPSGTVLYFSDNEWDASSSTFNSGEGFVSLTLSSAVSAGSVIDVDLLDKTVSPSIGTVKAESGTLALSTSGDQLYVYLGSDYKTPTKFLFAVNTTGGWDANQVPSDLTDGVNALSFPGSTDDIEYTGTRSGHNAAGYQIQISDIANNWATSGTAYTFDNTDFTMNTDPASKIVILNVKPTTPKVNSSFSVTVQAQNSVGDPTNVSSDETITLSVSSGSGTLGGTTSGKILASSNTISMTGLTYDKAETFTLQAAGSSLGNATKDITVVDNIPPDITNIANTPVNPIYNQDITISADITDPDGGTITYADFKFGTESGNYTESTTMNLTTAPQYTGVLPAKAAGTTIYYVVEATDNDGATTTSKEYSFTVVPNKSIYDIQYTTDASGDSPLKGTMVYTGGVVSAFKSGTGYFIQDNSGAWNGVFVYNPANTVAIGDSVTFSSIVNEYNNLTELKDIDNFKIVSSGNTLHSATEVNIADVDESYEGVLIEVTGTCSAAPDQNGEWQIKDGTNNLIIGNYFYSYTPELNKEYTITGVLNYSGGNYKLEPRDANDIKEVTSIDENYTKVLVYPNPAKNIIYFNANVKNVELFNTEGQKLNFKFYNNSMNISRLSAGIYNAKIYLDNGKIVNKQIVKQ